MYYGPVYFEPLLIKLQVAFLTLYYSLNSDLHPISPNNNTVRSNRQDMRMNEMITKKWNIVMLEQIPWSSTIKNVEEQCGEDTCWCWGLRG